MSLLTNPDRMPSLAPAVGQSIDISIRRKEPIPKALAARGGWDSIEPNADNGTEI
jgi:hypothetical protein